MSGLNHTLGVAAESLYASRQGVDTAGHNIANAPVEGYSRQRVNLEERMPSETRGLVIGNGVYAKNIVRYHDRFLEKQLNDANQDAGNSGAKFKALSALEEIFSPELSANVDNELGEFFNAMQDLSNFPDELAVRTNLLERSKNLLGAFKRVDNTLRYQQNIIDEQLKGEMDVANDTLSRLSKLNVEILALESNPGAVANDLRDEQERLLRLLSSKMDIRYYTDNRGMLVVRGPRETNLVEGRQHVLFGVVSGEPTASGGNFFDVVVTDTLGKNSRNITDHIHKGELRALLDVRDTVIEDLIASNNNMVVSLVDEFNTIHRQGFGLQDFRESQGRDFFAPITTNHLAASELRLADIILESTDAISVASSPDAPGDNVVANQLIRVKDKRLMENGNATLQEFYSSYVGSLGLEVLRGRHLKEADDILIGDLNTRRESVSGVSLDEEAINILKWQTNFAASSKLITTCDEMFETILSLKR